MKSLGTKKFEIGLKKSIERLNPNNNMSKTDEIVRLFPKVSAIPSRRQTLRTFYRTSPIPAALSLSIHLNETH